MKKEKKQRLRRIADRAQRRHSLKHPSITGTLKMTQSGFGFVLPVVDESSDTAEKIEEVFIPPQFVNGGIDGDLVMVELLPPRPRDREREDLGPSGRIVKIVERRKSEFVGELLPGGRIRAFNTRLPAEIKVVGSRKGAVIGDWLKLRLDTEADGIWYAVAKSVIGHAGILSSDLDAVMSEYGIPEAYSEEENQAAAGIVPREIERKDYRNLSVITLDPVDAKDFDDALSCTVGAVPGTLEIGIHIADVAAFIVPGSRFDIAAGTRCFSCYLPGRTLPMLPAALTAAISMHTGVDSLAHSVFVTVKQDTGEIVSSRREHTLIRVSARLDYDEVQRAIDSGKFDKLGSLEVVNVVKQLHEMSQKMRQNRFKKEKFIELPLSEFRVVCDEKNNVIKGIEERVSRPSEQLVEEFMLTANSLVGGELRDAGVAGIYRIHPEPEPERTMEFCDMMAESFGINCGNIADRNNCNRFIASLPDNPKRQVILGLLLRSMARAGYSEKGELHYALGKTFYCHFTSPIRRYTDLATHQQLWNFDRKVRTRSKQTMAKVAEFVTAMEEQVDNASMAAEDRLKLRYLNTLIESGDETMYEGIITKVINNGLQVSVNSLGVTGFVPLEQLRGSFSRHRSQMNSSGGHSSYKVGDYIYLRLARIDFSRNSAIFVPAGR